MLRSRRRVIGLLFKTPSSARRRVGEGRTSAGDDVIIGTVSDRSVVSGGGDRPPSYQG